MHEPCCCAKLDNIFFLFFVDWEILLTVVLMGKKNLLCQNLLVEYKSLVFLVAFSYHLETNNDNGRGQEI